MVDKKEELRERKERRGGSPLLGSFRNYELMYVYQQVLYCVIFILFILLNTRSVKLVFNLDFKLYLFTHCTSITQTLFTLWRDTFLILIFRIYCIFFYCFAFLNGGGAAVVLNKPDGGGADDVLNKPAEELAQI